MVYSWWKVYSQCGVAQLVWEYTAPTAVSSLHHVPVLTASLNNPWAQLYTYSTTNYTEHTASKGHKCGYIQLVLNCSCCLRVRHPLVGLWSPTQLILREMSPPPPSGFQLWRPTCPLAHRLEQTDSQGPRLKAMPLSDQASQSSPLVATVPPSPSGAQATASPLPRYTRSPGDTLADAGLQPPAPP